MSQKCHFKKESCASLFCVICISIIFSLHALQVQGECKVFGHPKKNETTVLIFHQIKIFLKVDENLGLYLPKMYNMLESMFLL